MNGYPTGVQFVGISDICLRSAVFKDLKASWFKGPGRGLGEGRGSGGNRGRGRSGRGAGHGGAKFQNTKVYGDPLHDTAMEDADATREIDVSQAAAMLAIGGPPPAGSGNNALVLPPATVPPSPSKQDRKRTKTKPNDKPAPKNITSSTKSYARLAGLLGGSCLAQ